MRSFKSVHSSLCRQGPVCQTEQEITKFLLSGWIDGWWKGMSLSLVVWSPGPCILMNEDVLPYCPWILRLFPLPCCTHEMFHQPSLNPLCEKVGITKSNCVASSVFVLSFDKTSRMELKRVSWVTSPAQNLLILLIYLFLPVLGLLMLDTGFLFSCSYGGLLPTCGTRASHCGDFSGCKAQASIVAACGL